MGTIPTTPTFTNPITSAYFASLKAVNDFWALTPRCYAYQSVAQSIPTGTTLVPVTLGAEIYDIVQSGDTPMHDNTTNPTRVFCRTAGKYEITGCAEFASNATGLRTATIRLNAAGVDTGGTLLVSSNQSPVSGAATTTPLSTIEVSLVAGDYVELFVRQTSGGALNTGPGQAQTFLRMKLTGS